MAFKLRLRGPAGRQHTANLSGTSATLADLQQEAANAFGFAGRVEVLLGFPPTPCTSAGSTLLSDLLQSGDAVTVREMPAGEPVPQQIQADEELARRLAAEDQEPNSAQSQIEADEDLARRLAVSEEGHQPSQPATTSGHTSTGSFGTGSVGIGSVDNVVQALGALAPLRDIRRRRFQGSNMGTMIDTVFEQLEELVAASQNLSSFAAADEAAVGGSGYGTDSGHQPAATSASAPGAAAALSQEDAIMAAARTGSVEALLLAAGAPLAQTPAPGHVPSVPAPPVATSTVSSLPVAALSQEEAIRAAARTGSVEAILLAAGAAPSVAASAASSPLVAARSREEAVRESAQTGSVEAITPAAGAAPSVAASAALLPAAVSASSGMPGNDGATTVPAPAAATVSAAASSTVTSSGAASFPAAATSSSAAAVSAAASSSSAPAAASGSASGARPHSAVFENYMAQGEARRAESRRRRAERLVALNAALDAHMAAGFVVPSEVPPAGDAQFIENHSTMSVWAGPADTTCVICVEDFVEGDNVRTLPCGHVYHKECVDTWLQRSRLCCLCKQPIDGSRGGH